MVLKKTPLNFTPFSDMDKSPFFSPSALGFTPADGVPAAPKSLDDIMTSSMFPTPNKSHESPRVDLNAELNDREAKSTTFNPICKIEVDDDNIKIASASNKSPEWTMVSVIEIYFIDDFVLVAIGYLTSHLFFNSGHLKI